MSNRTDREKRKKIKKIIREKNKPVKQIGLVYRNINDLERDRQKQEPGTILVYNKN